MREIVKHLLTARDGVSFSLTKAVVIMAVVAMIYNFVWHDSVDFNGFGLGVAAVMAILTAKYFVEDKEK